MVFEVDFPDVARRKAALIGSNETLRGMLVDQTPPLTGQPHSVQPTSQAQHPELQVLFMMMMMVR